jgi:hypothetical protein
MFGHLKPTEFISVLDGNSIPAKRSGHLEDCPNCRETLRRMSEVRDDVIFSDPDPLDRELASVDWNRLRSSVRDGLLAQSVKRSSTLRRWTGITMKPAAAWSLGLLLMASAVTAGGFWHYQTDHVRPMTAEGAADESAATARALLPGDLDPIAAEDLAWPQTDIFSALDELELNEEEALRELISLAAGDEYFFGDPFATDFPIDDGVFQ